MRNKKTKRIIVFTILLFLCLSCCIQVMVKRIQNNIFSSVEFSKSYIDRDGKLLQVFLTKDDKYRIYKNITYYSPEFIELILLQEDQFFFSHKGINPVSLVNGFITTFIRKERRIGGSTITMQVAKLKYHLYTRNIFGKIKQIFAALYLELCYSKQQILDYYLNLAPCGKNIEGFESASWYFFGKTITDITFSESLMLCVLPQNPNERIPTTLNTPIQLINAENNLLEKWNEHHDEITKNKILTNSNHYLICKMPNEVRHLAEMLNNKMINSKSSIVTTINLSLQKKCEDFLHQYINKNQHLGVKNAALLLVDNSNMEVLVNIGSANYYNEEIEGQVNGTISKRSPGSTLKPFVYALAIEQGLIHSNTMLKDTPITFNEYSPDNFGSVFKGPVSACYALCDSRNIPAISLATKLSNPDLYDYIEKAGVTKLKSKEHYGLSIVLGTVDVTMTELVEMYSAINNEGFQNSLKYTFQQNKTNLKKMLAKESAFIVKKMLEQNIPPYQTRPQETKLIPIAYKTGTSIGFKDGWTVAIFGQYTLCVWIGNFNGQGNNSFLGRTMAAPLAFKIADYLILNKMCDENYSSSQPDGVVQIDVCSVSGGIPNENCLRTEKAWFVSGVSPINKCKIHRTINIDTRTGYRTDEINKSYVKTVVKEFWPSDLQTLFLQAGLPRLVPPDYPPEEFQMDITKQGYPPEIISPMANTQYVYRTDDESKNQLVLIAESDSDSEELLWFCDDSFIGRSKKGEKTIWKADPGVYVLTVTDSKGRSSSINIKIAYDWQVNH